MITDILKFSCLTDCWDPKRLPFSSIVLSFYLIIAVQWTSSNNFNGFWQLSFQKTQSISSRLYPLLLSDQKFIRSQDISKLRKLPFSSSQKENMYLRLSLPLSKVIRNLLAYFQDQRQGLAFTFYFPPSPSQLSPPPTHDTYPQTHCTQTVCCATMCLLTQKLFTDTEGKAIVLNNKREDFKWK